MSKKRLSKDQKRKQKLKERARRQPIEPRSLAYTGDRYKSDKFTPYVHATESGIGQADLLAKRRLTDAHVRTAMEELVRAMSAGSLPPLSEQPLEYAAGREVELITYLIRVAWEDCFVHEPHPGQQALIGILRTLLNSIETFTTPAKGSRGYLSFLDGFLRRAGMSFSIVDRKGEELADSLPDDPLIDAGVAWIEDGDEAARREVYRLANERIQAGRHEEVAALAQTLLGLMPPHDIVMQLSVLSLSAQSRKPLELP